jgi:hypothetical protein
VSRQNRQSLKKSKNEQLDIVIKALANGKSQGEAAHEAGISTRSLQRWILIPEVKLRILALQEENQRARALSQENQQSQPKNYQSQEFGEDVPSQIKRLIPLGINCLENILTSEDSRTADKLQAIKLLLHQWERLQTPKLPSEIEAIKTLVDADYLPYHHLVKISESLNSFNESCRDILNNDSSSVGRSLN